MLRGLGLVALLFSSAAGIKPLARLPTMTSKSQDMCNVLALSGGGSFGAVQMGMLDLLLETQLVPDTYDIITGISAGGLNAGFLSYSSNVSSALPAIQSVYANLTTDDIYTRDLFRILSEYSIYNTAPLRTTLAGILAGKTPALDGPITIVGSTNVNTQTLDVFRFDTADVADKISVLMATSAIPLAFPPQLINGHTYVDGGVISNEMIQQAVSQKSCSFYNFTFISASSHSPSNITIDGLFSYITALGKLILNTFDYQLAEYESVTCMEPPRGSIQACFPTSPDLNDYSILDFDNGVELYALGKSGVNCISYNYC